jgi:hypothetical protein
LGRIFDFLGWATGGTGLINVPGQAQRLASFITTYPDLLASVLATINVQAVANTANVSDHPDRGQQFLGDLLTGLLNAFQGTNRTDLNNNSDSTDVSYKVWAVDWPRNGVPGRGLEIALPRETAFTFLQNVLFDDVLTNTMVNGNKPLIGYISIRVTPQTKALMGMQQVFTPIGHDRGRRSPEANAVMTEIQRKALNRDLRRLDLMLHWGLENDQMISTDLERMPISQPLRPGSPFTRLSAFKRIRQLLIHGHSPSPFDNNFVTRLNLGLPAKTTISAVSRLEIHGKTPF